MKKTLIVRNNLIPFRSFAAINLFGVVFVRNEAKVDDTLINHELIHTKQMKELFYVGFYILYLFFWLRLLFSFGFNSARAYRHIPFEIEAYENEHDLTYLSKRQHYIWTHYL